MAEREPQKHQNRTDETIIQGAQKARLSSIQVSTKVDQNLCTKPTRADGSRLLAQREDLGSRAS